MIRGKALIALVCVQLLSTAQSLPPGVRAKVSQLEVRLNPGDAEFAILELILHLRLQNRSAQAVSVAARSLVVDRIDRWDDVAERWALVMAATSVEAGGRDLPACVELRPKLSTRGHSQTSVPFSKSKLAELVNQVVRLRARMASVCGRGGRTEVLNFTTEPFRLTIPAK